ncbi:hypothetical protein ACSU1N_00535 [Thermogladius sp. 4427co]|uniref:hypothetical protein n=1 Tax=Thermogladius sp. 4427co TaxID=3450718 RepID=UPI003F7AA071
MKARRVFKMDVVGNCFVETRLCSGVDYSFRDSMIEIRAGREGIVVFKHSPGERIICDGESFSVTPWGMYLYTSWETKGLLKCFIMPGVLEEITEGVYLLRRSLDETIPQLELDEYYVRVFKSLIGWKPVFILLGGGNTCSRQLINTVNAEEGLAGKIRDILQQAIRNSVEAECVLRLLEQRAIDPGLLTRLLEDKIRIECTRGGGFKLYEAG